MSESFGRLTKVSAVGWMAAAVLFVAENIPALAGGNARPFKAVGASNLTADPNDPSGASGTFEVVGNATHLGNFFFPGTWKVVGVNAVGGYVYRVEGMYVAANGDTIKILCPDWGIDDGANPEFSTGIVQIIGGTGRFANASGSYKGSLSPVPGPTLFTAEGTISY